MICRIKCDCFFLKYCVSEGDSINCYFFLYFDWFVIIDFELFGLYFYFSVVWFVFVRGGYRFVRELIV